MFEKVDIRVKRAFAFLISIYFWLRFYYTITWRGIFTLVAVMGFIAISVAAGFWRRDGELVWDKVTNQMSSLFGQSKELELPKKQDLTDEQAEQMVELTNTTGTEMPEDYSKESRSE